MPTRAAGGAGQQSRFTDPCAIPTRRTLAATSRSSDYRYRHRGPQRPARHGCRTRRYSHADPRTLSAYFDTFVYRLGYAIVDPRTAVIDPGRTASADLFCAYPQNHGSGGTRQARPGGRRLSLATSVTISRSHPAAAAHQPANFPGTQAVGGHAR